MYCILKECNFMTRAQERIKTRQAPRLRFATAREYAGYILHDYKPGERREKCPCPRMTMEAGKIFKVKIY